MQEEIEMPDRAGIPCPAAESCGAALDRRGFLTRAALAAVTVALAACAAGDATGPDLSGSSTIKVSDYPALANVNGVAMFTVQQQPLAVVRTSATTFLALSRVCPHQGGIIGASSTGFTCPVHGARFNLTGQWIGGQPTSNMRSFSTSYDATSDTLTIG
ncbi:MAG TPA: Rieske (2Fe-2S) protein [Longimicrobiales bacterium]